MCSQDIVGLTSVEGECVPFVNAVETAGELNGVERWLLKCEEVMRKSLHAITCDAIAVRLNKPRRQSPHHPCHLMPRLPHVAMHMLDWQSPW